MVICMSMESGERSYLEPENDVVPAYDEEVLNANLLPPELPWACRKFRWRATDSIRCPRMWMPS